MNMNRFCIRAKLFVVCLLGIVPLTAFSQEFIYVSTTEGERTIQEINNFRKGPYQIVEISEPDRYSKYFFCAQGTTEEWIHRNDKENTNFVAEREDNTIRINGTLKDEKVQKTVSIDGDLWLNKIDFGLSQFAMSDRESITFWTLKLSDLEPLHFRAEKMGVETLQINNQQVQAIKLKMTLKNFLLSKLWSANLWYRASDGLFLKYEGAKGGPGTPVTVIKIAKGM